MLVLAIARSDEYLASLACRIREADVDPAVKGAVLTIIDGLRADLAALVPAATSGARAMLMLSPADADRAHDGLRRPSPSLPIGWTFRPVPPSTGELFHARHHP